MLDSSKSIGSKNWPFIRDFTAYMAGIQDIGLNDSLMGIILFGGHANIHFNVRRYLDQASLVQAINNIGYNSSFGTKTSLAINLLRESSLPNGAMMLREGFPHIAVVITDGRSHNENATNMAAQQLHEANTFDHIYAIGIGKKKISIDELRSIASDDSSVYILADFEESLFTELQYNLSRQLCNICKLIVAIS